MATVFKINFDFTSMAQHAILNQLQNNRYKLFGYKGASGPNQVTAGLPTWFSMPYSDMYGQLEIDYEPLYKVYVYNDVAIGANITIRMEALSTEVPLGTAVTFNADGTFLTSNNAPDGIITVNNNRPVGTQNLIIGLAAKINGQFNPFCAFISTPQGSLSIKPNNKIVLFAAQSDAVSGTVISNTLNSGCAFEFNASNSQYDLEMIPGTLGIMSALGGNPVTQISSGASLEQFLNTP